MRKKLSWKQKLIRIVSKQVKDVSRIKTRSKSGSTISTRASDAIGGMLERRDRIEDMTLPDDPHVSDSVNKILYQVRQLERDKLEQVEVSLKRIRTCVRVTHLVEKAARSLARPMGDGPRQRYKFTSSMGPIPEGSKRLSELRQKDVRTPEEEAEALALQNQVVAQLVDHPRLTVTYE